MSQLDPIDISLQLAATGAPITLRELGGGQPMLVVLMRHLDCPFCEVHVGRIMHARDHLGRVVLVGNATPAELAEQHVDLPPEFVLVADADQSLYRAYRTHRLRSSLSLRISPRAIPTFLRHFLGGGKLQRAGQDLLQLGGDVVIDASGATTWLRNSTRPDDRPNTAKLAEHLHLAA